jgi:VIT1/CCC1 family predicted Fe2+/Mn2+ transporter
MTVQEEAIELHHSHRDVMGGWLRPTVFGIMDGVISNTCLIAGVAGANISAKNILLSGLAGLIAGSCSMAAGEYVSVTSQGELMQAEAAIERRELQEHPEDEERELALLYERRGLDRELALRVSHELSKEPELAWRTHVREELGVDPDDLPSPRLAAVSSFLSFALGALLPLAPYAIGLHLFAASLALASVALAVAGAAVAHLTGKSYIRGALRQLGMGLMAAGITYLIGHIVGVSVS